MAAEEYANLLGKPKGSLDAHALTTYLIVVMLHAREELEKEGKDFNLIARKMLLEHFTVRVLGMSSEFYSFVTFSSAEKCIMDCKI